MDEAKNTKHTFNSQTPVDADAVLATLRAAGFPLASSSELTEGESDNSKLVCVAEVRNNMIHAIVASPSGIVYRFEPTVFEPSFWSFAGRHYYFVTGNIADRRRVAELAGIEFKDIKGKTLARGKSESLSEMTLDGMLSHIASLKEPQQESLLGVD